MNRLLSVMLVVTGVLRMHAMAALDSPVRVPLADAGAEFKAAQEAEKNGDVESALLHYENLLDAARNQTKVTTRAMLYGKLAELKRKVAPNRDPAKSGEWKVKAYAFRTTDVKWTDRKGTNRHALFRFTDPQIDNLRHEMTNFAAKVWDYSLGSLRINWDLTVIDQPLTEWHGWPELGVCMPYFKDLKYGEADSVFVFAKASGGKEDQKCDPLDWMVWGGTIGVTAETKGATYIGFNCGPDPAEDGSGELELHEWTHVAEMGLKWVQAYGDQDLVDWSGDGGGYHERWKLWKRAEGERTWLGFYQCIMRDWTTRKMWRELSVTRRSNNPWLNDYVRDFLALGPFPVEGGAGGGLDSAFIDEAKAAPKVGDKAGDKEWKLASAPGKYLALTPVFQKLGEGQVYYLAFTAQAGRGHRALLQNQRDGPCKIWQNGELIYVSRVNREWSNPPNVIDVNLKKGANLFLLKLGHVSSDWSFNLKLTSLSGGSLSDVEFVTPAAH